MHSFVMVLTQLKLTLLFFILYHSVDCKDLTQRLFLVLHHLQILLLGQLPVPVLVIPLEHSGDLADDDKDHHKALDISTCLSVSLSDTCLNSVLVMNPSWSLV